MQLSAEEILHSAFRETLDYRGEDAFVPQLLRDAERYLKGDIIAEPGGHGRHFYNRYVQRSPSHTCMDFPNMECPACACIGFRHADG